MGTDDVIESIDAHFVRRVTAWQGDDGAGALQDPAGRSMDAARLLACFEAQVQSRHLDLAARWLQERGEGFYTIGSSGHESNAAVALALRPTDPALLHYRSGGFYAARAQQVPGTTPIADVLRGAAASVDDPISGGRHKVFGHHALSVIPQTSTIGSHLPRAFGLAFSVGRAASLGLESPWPDDAVVVTSFGDASVNHSTTVGALNAAAYCTTRGVPVPLLLVCEDNGFGISTPTPAGWVAGALSRWSGVDYLFADGFHPAEVMVRADEAVRTVRDERRPVILHLRTVRLMGHAGSDVELGYRSRAEIVRDYERDPLLGAAATLVGIGALTPADVLARYEQARQVVMQEAERVIGTSRLASAAQVMAPLTARRPDAVRAAAGRAGPGGAPMDPTPVTLAGSVNATLHDLLAARPEAVVFGQDVAAKGGVYGVTRGLQKRFGGPRVFDTLLDEQTVLGTALGGALAGLLPIVEVQYLAYLHNAEDQLRGEGASLAFFSDGQYRNGMVVRVPGLGYQKGFGGHFHNDNSVAVLRDVPGLVVAVPSHPAEVPALLRTCVGLAVEEGRVCVFLEPIALYHQRDLFEGDGEWLAPYQPPSVEDAEVFGEVAVHGAGEDLLIVTFGNGVRMSMRAAERLREQGVASTVLDLRWLAPLPVEGLARHARRFRHVLVVDETRAGGGVSEGVIAALADQGYDGRVRRVTSRDSFVPLGPASGLVLVSEDDVVAAGVSMVEGGGKEAEGMENGHSAGGRHARRADPEVEGPDPERNRTMSDIAGYTHEILERLGVKDPFDHAGTLVSRSPIDGSEIGRLRTHTSDEVASVVGQAQQAFEVWRTVPAPVRGELVRELGQLLREHKEDLGALVSIEAGKIVSEGLGEVQEMIDICDLAVGLSRQLFGLTIASERPGHRMMEQWHPLGVVGVISAFNFPVAVWSWNTALALVCGDAVVWKPSEKTALTGLACQALTAEAARRVGAPEHVSSVVLGDASVGLALVDDPRVALVSATGSTRMGKAVAPRVAGRLGRLLLELGGNNAAIVAPSADLELAVRGIVFSAVGTAGQRCTSLRRVIAHSSIHDELVERLRLAYESLPIGSPLEGSTLVGPLVDEAAGEAFEAAIRQAVEDGGTLVTGGDRASVDGGGCYVRPAIVTMPSQTAIVQAETFAPLLHVLSYDDLDEAIALHNDVTQGLSSSIFTLDVREAERFVSATGSDCGIANVNIGPSGAEIGGAFGGEKETGGGRESGSDAWKSYMRRTTNTVNYTTELPLAQGVEFL